MRMLDNFREARDLATLMVDLSHLLPDRSELNTLLTSLRDVNQHVECPHNESHILTFVVEMLRFQNERPDDPGEFVEAGCYKGGSTAKFSIVAKRLGRPLTVFDSFMGIPDNEEAHASSIFGYSLENWFAGGAFEGSLAEVRRNVEDYGEIEVCEFVPGWFDETLPKVDIDIAAAYLDVDLASSTQSCLQYLYPRLVPGGVLVSQDGDFPLVIDVFDDDQFWEEVVGVSKPKIHGLRSSKMLRVYKDA